MPSVRCARSGSFGVAGRFEAMFGSARCQAEVASVYAEIFHRLGYLPVGDLIGPDRWQELTAGLRERFEDHDVRRSEAEQLLGTPSLTVDNRVLCYVPADPSLGWLSVVCHAADVRSYEPGHGRYRSSATPIRSSSQSA